MRGRGDTGTRGDGAVRKGACGELTNLRLRQRARPRSIHRIVNIVETEEAGARLLSVEVNWK